MTLRTFKKYCAQGDVRFERMPEGTQIPENFTIPNVDFNRAAQGKLIITHSETGHHHSMVLDRDNVRMYTSDENPMISWLEVNRPTSLDHERSFDTHDPILFEKGLYKVYRQREHTPEGWRRVED